MATSAAARTAAHRGGRPLRLQPAALTVAIGAPMHCSVAVCMVRSAARGGRAGSSVVGVQARVKVVDEQLAEARAATRGAPSNGPRGRAGCEACCSGKHQGAVAGREGAVAGVSSEAGRGAQGARQLEQEVELGKGMAAPTPLPRLVT